MQSGQRLTLPGGIEFLLVVSEHDTGGERVEFEITLPPGAPSPPRHRHPRQEEQWHVLEGSFEALVGRRWRTLAAGESLTIPPGKVHTLRNRSAEPVRVRDVHVPALGFEDYIEHLHGALASSGGRPRPSNVVALASVLVAHRGTQVTASPAQRLAETVLAGVARLRRRG